MPIRPRSIRISRDHPTHLKESLAWKYAAVLTSIQFRETDDGWLVVIKADHGRRPMVSFLNVNCLEDCPRVACEYAGKGTLYWKPDKWPVSIRGRRKRSV